MTAAGIRVGIDLARQGGRIAVRDGRDVRIIEGDAASVPAFVNGLPRADALLRAAAADLTAVEDLHEHLFENLRALLNDEPVLDAVISVPSYLGPAGVRVIERSARRSGFRSAQTLAEPTAVAIEYAATRGSTKVESAVVACVTLMSADVGVFSFEQGKVLPRALSGRPGPQPNLDAIREVWEECLRRRRPARAPIDALVLAGQVSIGPSVSELFEALSGMHVDQTVSRLDAVVLGALRCAEVLDWDNVVPIRDE